MRSPEDTEKWSKWKGPRLVIIAGITIAVFTVAFVWLFTGADFPTRASVAVEVAETSGVQFQLCSESLTGGTCAPVPLMSFYVLRIDEGGNEELHWQLDSPPGNAIEAKTIVYGEQPRGMEERKEAHSLESSICYVVIARFEGGITEMPFMLDRVSSPPTVRDCSTQQ